MSQSGIGTAPARIAGLDSLRALAICGVLAYHFWPAAVPGGFVGVDVFLVLSGFLITLGLVRDAASRKSDEAAATANPHPLRNFWSRRLRRIYPALVVMILGVTVLATALGGDSAVRLGPQIAAGLTGTTNWLTIAQGGDYFAAATPTVFQHLWFVAVILQFYLLWPLLLRPVLRHTSRAAWWVLPAALLLGSLAWSAWLAARDANQTRLYEGTDTHLFSLMLGAVVATLPLWLGRRNSGKHHSEPTDSAPALDRSASPVTQVAAALALAAGVGLLLYFGFTLRWDSAFNFSGGMPLAALATGGSIVALRYLPHAAAALDRGPVSWLGRRSYGIYLWHWPLLILVTNVFGEYYQTASWSTVIAVLAGSCAIAELSARLVEQPLIDGGWAALRPASDGHGAWRTALAVLSVGAVVASGFGLARAPDLTEAETLAEEGRRATHAAQLTRDWPSPSDELGVQINDPSPMLRLALSSEATYFGGPDEVPVRPAASDPEPAELTGHEVTALGDSVMLGSASAIFEVLPDIYLDADMSRSLVWAPAAISKLVASGALREYVVIALATNTTAHDSQIDAIMQAIGPGHKVVFVNAYGARKWIPGTNEVIGRVEDRYPGEAYVADWQGVVAQNPALVGSDGVHPTRAGTAAYAEVLQAALARAAAD